MFGRSLVLLIGCLCLPPVLASESWQTRGGRGELHVLEHWAGHFGLRGEPTRQGYRVWRFALDPEHGMRFDARHGAIEGFESGQWRVQDELRLVHGRGQIVIENPRLVPGGGDALLRLVDAAGVEWFHVQRIHRVLDPEGRNLRILNGDLRLSAAAAQWLGQPALAGALVGKFSLDSPVVARGAQDPGLSSCASPNWPGKPIDPLNPEGPRYQADVLLTNVERLQFMRCEGCDGPGGADGRLVWAPDAVLRNSDRPDTADVPWYWKFRGLWSLSGTNNFPPYNNDQHPFLIWNVYRLDAQGRLEQIGRSGLKHAFLTVNSGCVGCPSNPNHYHVLWANCADVYGAATNDTGSDLGPRRELVPEKGIWGRCGSIYDPNCDAVEEDPAYGPYDHRLTVRESQIDPGSNPGARYFVEAWYVVRDDIDVYNTMGWREFDVQYFPPDPPRDLAWMPRDIGPFTPGPLIDFWVNPSGGDPLRRNRELRTPEGRFKLAVRVSALGGDRYRYDYALYNVDYARARTEGAEPNLRVLSNRGFDRFELRLSAAAAPSGFGFADGDLVPGNDWTASGSGRRLIWTAPPSFTLDWGTLYRFSVEASGAPVSGIAIVRMPELGDVDRYVIDTLVPGGPEGQLLADGFD